MSQGVCIWLTGRGGAGKSTLTAALVPLLESQGRTVTVLDVVPELRKLPCERSSRGKLIRKAFVAREIVRHGGVVVCVTISSRREIREEARQLIGADGFVEVYVHVPEEVSASRKQRRPKRPSVRKRVERTLRTWARRLGLARNRSFEIPLSPDVSIDTVAERPEDGAMKVMDVLARRGFVGADPLGS